MGWIVSGFSNETLTGVNGAIEAADAVCVQEPDSFEWL